MLQTGSHWFYSVGIHMMSIITKWSVPTRLRKNYSTVRTMSMLGCQTHWRKVTTYVIHRKIPNNESRHCFNALSVNAPSTFGCSVCNVLPAMFVDRSSEAYTLLLKVSHLETGPSHCTSPTASSSQKTFDHSAELRRLKLMALDSANRCAAETFRHLR